MANHTYNDTSLGFIIRKTAEAKNQLAVHNKSFGDILHEI